MDMQQPPAIVENFMGEYKFEITGPTYLIIPGQVKINLQDGSLTFESGYSPDQAAKQFWEAMSQEYRNMLRWKAEQKPR